ncbi:MAG: MerR family transcriptional regulator [Actinobacteria bacterium]|nr:MerR family transcriptional regulator [Actinomycetota bacterium]
MSIGEVLALLLEEFPDVTISKIRFLESQGLIDPERTPSGYRKFYDADVDRLRVILREQRENFLPLRVIRDRLENGQIDDSGALTPPRGIRNVTVLERESESDETGEQIVPEGTVVPTGHHPAAQLRIAVPPVAQPALPAQPEPTDAPANPAAQFFAPSEPLAQLDSVPDSFSAAELCTMAGITSKQLGELESFGLVSGKGAGNTTLYSTSDLAIVKAAAGFLVRGVEARHLRGWKQSAEREASLFEQLVVPLLRQRNPQSRHQAALSLGELSAQGAELRAALLTAALRQHLET